MQCNTPSQKVSYIWSEQLVIRLQLTPINPPSNCRHRKPGRAHIEIAIDGICKRTLDRVIKLSITTEIGSPAGVDNVASAQNERIQKSIIGDPLAYYVSQQGIRRYNRSRLAVLAVECRSDRLDCGDPVQASIDLHNHRCRNLFNQRGTDGNRNLSTRA